MNQLTEGIRVIYQSTIRMEREQVIYFDPYGVKEPAHDTDIIFITHDHYDHFSPEDLAKVRKADTKIVLPEKMASKAKNIPFSDDQMIQVQPEQHYECFGLRFQTVPAYNHLKPFHPKRSGWTGYLLEWGGSTYYIAGDTDVTKENQMLKCDAAFLPIGGTYTMNAKEAAKLANIIHPQVVVPIHYGCIVGERKDADVFENMLEPGIACIKLMEFGE